MEQKDIERVTPLIRALYLGQSVYCENYRRCKTPLSLNPIDLFPEPETDVIVLRPLSDLTDQEALMLFQNTYPMFVNSHTWDGKDMATVRRLNDGIYTQGSYSAKTHNTLTYLSCPVKYFDSQTGETLTPEQMQEYGIIKLKERL